MADPRLVHRSVVLLASAQVALWAAIGAFAAFGPIASRELSGRAGGAPLLFGLYYLGAAAGAVLAGRIMDRAGRRPGLAAGYVVVIVAGCVAAVAIASGSHLVLIASGPVLGLGVGAALLGRGAVADLYPPERRGRAVGLLVLAGTAGAVGGPPLASAVHAVGGTLWAPYLLVPAFGAVALGLVLGLRPDPRELAFDPPGGPRRRPSEVLRQRSAIAAVTTIGVTQAVMVTFMSVIPVVVHEHGADELTVSLVVSFHLGGMFVFSRAIGGALDRWGRRPGLVGGVGLTGLGVALTLANQGTLVAGLGLFLIGVGWSAAYVASTAVVSDLATPAERGSALGLADLIAAVAAGLGVLLAAAVLEGAGFTVLGLAALMLLVIPGALLVPMREARAVRPVAAP